MGTACAGPAEPITGGFTVRRSISPKMAELCGTSDIPRGIRRDSLFAARALQGRSVLDRKGSLARLETLNPNLALVVAAANLAIAGYQGCRALREFFIARAPVAACAVGLSLNDAAGPKGSS